uniref:B3_4 domain-containing protein n=1 Tax=Syphacia muris TaxID=451379 RepID=A0A0N5AGY7_9BILA
MEIGTSSDVEIEHFPNWPELRRLVKENRCELVLTDEDLSLRKPSVNEEILQKAIFRKDSPINFLDLSSVNLSVLYPSVSRLTYLTNLSLRLNRLRHIPEEIGSLKKLKVLDLSFNQIECLPTCLNQLKSLTTFNLSNNKLQLIPNLSGLSSLQILNLCCNSITEFPSMLPANNSKLQELLLSNNQIKLVPETLEELVLLKKLDLSKNCLRELPVGITCLPKLKELNLASNCFADKRFGKLTEDKRHSASSIIDYLKKKTTKSSKVDNAQIGMDTVPEDGEKNCRRLIIRYGTSIASVIRDESVADIRPHIVCCILHNICFDEKKLKQFLSLQTKLHDTLCVHRTLATIGTHDCNKLSFPLRYLAKVPDELHILPLNRGSQVSGRELVVNLKTEAQMLAKKQKLKTFSSVHKYLYMVEKLEKYPCLVDENNTVVSFPPVTNSESSKLSTETHDVFVEVTSDKDQAICRSVMDSLIEKALKIDLSSELIVEQLKVFQANGNLLVAYPSKLDLQLPGVHINKEIMNN